MVRKTKEEAQETHNRILEAAANIFSAKGVNASTLEDIAEEAGLTRGAIYWHFKNKQDLFSALHDQIHNTFTDLVVNRYNVVTDKPLEQLIELCMDILRDFDTNEQLRKSISIFTHKCEYSGNMACVMEKQNKSIETSLTMVTDFFKRAVAHKELPANSDCTLLTHAMFCYISGIMNEDLQNPEMLNLKERARPLIDIFFNGAKNA